MEKQTAVDFIVDKLSEILGDICNDLSVKQTLRNHYAIKEAKAIEKQQIIDADLAGVERTLRTINNHTPTPITLELIEAIKKGETNHEDGEQYYESTFKTKEENDNRSNWMP